MAKKTLATVIVEVLTAIGISSGFQTSAHPAQGRDGADSRATSCAAMSSGGGYVDAKLRQQPLWLLGLGSQFSEKYAACLSCGSALSASL